jgi:uncharacterized glyoxalase superfamily protein PhnB
VPYGKDMLPNIFPVLRYDNAPAAIDFLIGAFGFDKASEHRLADGRVVHADLRFGPSVVGVSSTGTSPAGSPWGTVRQGVYIVVDEPDAFFARAQAAGADVALPITDQSYGSRDFTLRDPEGHLWGFGTYAMERGSGAPTIVPEVLYQDPSAAADWMQAAMGFRQSLTARSEDGSLQHAELRLGDGVVFLGSAPLSGPFKGITHFANLRVDDPDAHCSRARASGATIVMEPQVAPYGARFYATRDPEGFLWWISTIRQPDGASRVFSLL